MTPPPEATNGESLTSGLVRVPHPALSLWQSSVREVVASHIANGDLNSDVVAAHQLVRAADEYAVRSRQVGGPIEVQWRPGEPVNPDNMFEVAMTYGRTLIEKAGLVAESIGHFTDLDPLFVESVLEFAKWYWLAHHKPMYRDWELSPDGLTFGIIDQRLPANARIGVIGDWGTGLSDAAALLRQLLVQYNPATLIHVGDIYYSGTPAECRYKFSGVIDRVVADLQARAAPLTVYTLPGNHDYYSGGSGFYQLIDGLNEDAAKQKASYFCLRTADDAFQFLGMDTGFFDREPGIAFNKGYTGPAIHDSEATWMLDKLDRFGGRSVLLSHNQPFSAHSALNGPKSGLPPFVNRSLIDAFQPHFDKIAAWFWGHEHCLVVYEDDTLGLPKGRLIGCSAFETGLDDDPYLLNFPEIRLKSPAVVLSKEGKWFDHGCAVIDCGARTITYLEIQSWVGRQPTPEPQLQPIFIEDLR